MTQGRLVLSRKEGQSVMIGDNIKITITHIQWNKVRIGIDAPNTMKILRDELVDIRPQPYSKGVENAKGNPASATQELTIGHELTPDPDQQV